MSSVPMPGDLPGAKRRVAQARDAIVKIVNSLECTRSELSSAIRASERLIAECENNGGALMGFGWGQGGKIGPASEARQPFMASFRTRGIMWMFGTKNLSRMSAGAENYPDYKKHKPLVDKVEAAAEAAFQTLQSVYKNFSDGNTAVVGKIKSLVQSVKDLSRSIEAAIGALKPIAAARLDERVEAKIKNQIMAEHRRAHTSVANEYIPLTEAELEARYQAWVARAKENRHPYAQYVIPRTGENMQQGDMGAMRSAAAYLDSVGLSSMAETFRKATGNAPRRVA